jgi:D-glycero-alpha-D-manno-heptose 1-phosphate guanylyltransferase
VLLEGTRIVGYEEKGRGGAGWINAGAYVLPKRMEWRAELGEKFSFERDFLATETARLAPAAFEVNGFFLDIGVPEDLDRAQRELAGR